MIKHASECPCQYRHLETWRPHTHGTNDTKPRMLPHTASPPFSANRQPSLTHIDTPPSLTHPSCVSWSKRPAGRTLIALVLRSRDLGTRRGGSQPSHSPPAHARCVHQHAHACAPCTCAMHMHVCTVCVCLCGRVGSVCVCVCVCVGRG